MPKIRVLVLTLVATLCASKSLAADPVWDFITLADSLAQSGDEQALQTLVSEQRFVVGAAVGELLDVAIEVGDEGQEDGERENVDFAERLADLLVERGGSEGPKNLVSSYSNWNEAQRQSRQLAKAKQAEAVEARNSSELDRAVDLNKAALELYDSIGDDRSVAIIWGSLGVVHWSRGDFATVRSSYEAALEARRAIDDNILVGRTLNGLGSVHYQLGEYSEALALYEQAIEIRQKTGDLAGLGTSLTYMGNTHLKLTRPVEARQYYERAAPILEAAGNAKSRFERELSIAGLFTELGRHNRAAESYAKALRLAQQTGEPGDEALVRFNLSAVLRQDGRYRESLAELELAEPLVAQQPNPEDEYILLRERGLTYSRMGEMDRATEAILASLEQAELLEQPGYRIEALANLGYLYLDLNDPQKALEVAERAMNFAESIEDPGLRREALVLTASAAREAGDYSRALQHFDQALEMDSEAGFLPDVVMDELGRANTLANLNELEKARAGYRRATAHLKQLGDDQPSWVPLLGLAHTFEASHPDSASHYYESALQAVERERSSVLGSSVLTGFFSGDRGHVYEEIVRFYAQTEAEEPGAGWSERAFSVSERSKARGLLDQIRRAGESQLGDRADGILDSLYVIDGTTPGARERRQRLEETFATLQSQVISTSSMELSQSSVVSIEELQQVLPPKTTLLQYAAGDSASFLWAIQASAHELHELPPRSALAIDVQQLRSMVIQPSTGDRFFRSIARRLYDTLVGPVRHLVDESELIIIVPDDVLLELPFEVLLQSEPDKDAGWPDFDYLARHVRTLYAPSSSVFVANLNRRSEKGATGALELLAFADANYESVRPSSRGPSHSLQPLPHAAREVESIAQHVKESASVVRIGSLATEAELKRQLRQTHTRVLHLATHGIVDATEPSRSCVVLGASDDDSEDGLFYTLEILAQPVRAELVVLSACDTGRGRIQRGEGVVGLGRAFMASGARGVVASLWRVADASTALLMEAMYKELFQKEEPAANALHTARLRIAGMEEYAHPYYWAAFVALGSPEMPW